MDAVFRSIGIAGLMAWREWINWMGHIIADGWVWSW